jgi:glycosyltransferase involved in cell wall biosynthesis
MNSTVSVIIPTFNGSKTIKDAINSVFEQTYKDYEIIVIDDGSTDLTVDIVRKFQPAIKIIQQPNQGTMAARQNGIDSAKGEFIAFLDQDDRWFPQKLTKQVRLLRSHPEIGAILSNMKAVDENGTVLGFNVVPPHQCYSPSSEDLLLFNPGYPSSSLARKEVLTRIGGLDCSFGSSGAFGDSDMFVRIGEVAKVHFMNECVGYYCWSELRPARLSSFLDNLPIYASKHWNRPPLSDANNISLRAKFVRSCSDFVMHVCRLLVKQYKGEPPYELLLKLNDHHKAMESLFGSLYQSCVGLKSVDLTVTGATRADLNTLLFLYLLRSDLQNRFPQVMEGQPQGFIEWARNVADGRYYDDTSKALRLRRLTSGFELTVDVYTPSVNAGSHKPLGVKIFDFMARYINRHTMLINTLLPPRSKRRHLCQVAFAGTRILFTEGPRTFVHESSRYVGNKLHGFQQGNQASRPVDAKSSVIANKLQILLSDAETKLVFPKCDQPLVTIILHVFDNAQYTYECSEGILAYTTIPYGLIVVNHGTTAETKEFLSRLDNVAIIDSDSSKETYGLLLEQLAKGKYILLLRNDVIVTSGYLEQMVEAMESHRSCGAVGCKIISCSGQLLEAGGITWNDNTISDYGFGDRSDKPEYSYVREVDFCSSICLLVKREVFQAIHSGSESLYSSHHEGAQICKAVRDTGYKAIYQPSAVVMSRCQSEFGLRRTNVPRRNDNRKGTLQSKVEPKKSKRKHENDLLMARTTTNTPRILVVDDYIPAIGYGCGFPRLHSMLRCLADLGYSVTFFPVGNPVKAQPATRELQQSGIEVFWNRYVDFERFSLERSQYYDVVLVSRPHVFEGVLTTVKERFAKAAIVYDAEALFCAREILKAEITGKGLPKEEQFRMINSELRLIKQADLVICVSQNEKRIIEENAPERNIEVWEHVQQTKKSAAAFNERHGILFFGSFFAGPGSPNEDAIVYFAKEVFPELRRALPCKLYIVGTDPTGAVRGLSRPDVEVTGYVENLGTYFDKCRVNVVPTRYAAGIPLKLIEAMSYGIPSVVTTLIGGQLNLCDRKEALIAGDSHDFVEKVIELYSNEELWRSIQRNELDYIDKNFSSVKMHDRLDMIIQKGLATRAKKHGLPE